MAEPLSTLPKRIYRSSSVLCRFEDSGYAAADGWEWTWSADGPGGTTAVNASSDGSGFLLDLNPSITASIPAGWYDWQLWARRTVPSAESVMLLSGRLEVARSLIDDPSTTGDRSGHARRMVVALEALLEGRATDGQLRMSINGRSLDRIPILEARQLLSAYRMELRAEDAALAQGATPGKRRRIKVRF